MSAEMIYWCAFFFIFFVIFSLVAWLYELYIKKSCFEKSNKELQKLINNPKKNRIYRFVLEELKRRNEDYSVVLPNLLDLALSNKMIQRMLDHYLKTGQRLALT